MILIAALCLSVYVSRTLKSIRLMLICELQYNEYVQKKRNLTVSEFTIYEEMLKFYLDPDASKTSHKFGGGCPQFYLNATFLWEYCFILCFFK